jgi:hypothetical protein
MASGMPTSKRCLVSRFSPMSYQTTWPRLVRPRESGRTRDPAGLEDGPKTEETRPVRIRFASVLRVVPPTVHPKLHPTSFLLH